MEKKDHKYNPDNLQSDVVALKETVSDLSESFNTQIGKIGQQLKKYSAQGMEKAAHTIEAHPLKSVGITLACGLILGFLMGKR